MSLGSALRTVAKGAMDRFGTSATLVLVTKGTFDASTLSTTGGGEAEVPVKGAFEPYKARFAESDAEGEARTGDHQLTIPAKDLSRAPTAQDGVKIDGVGYEIQHVDPIRAQDDVVAYRLHLVR